MVTKGTLYLGVDGGGSNCRARIEDERGTVLGEGATVLVFQNQEEIVWSAVRIVLDWLPMVLVSLKSAA